MVIVDSSVWILFFQARASPEHLEVDRLLMQGEVLMLGVIVAELLQGARTERELASLHQRLTSLPYAQETQEAWTRVGRLSYQLLQRGVTITLVDLLIADLAKEYACPVYTLDEHFKQMPGVVLHEASAAS